MSTFKQKAYLCMKDVRVLGGGDIYLRENFLIFILVREMILQHTVNLSTDVCDMH